MSLSWNGYSVQTKIDSDVFRIMWPLRRLPSRTTVLLEVEGFANAPPPSAVVVSHHSTRDADHH